MSKENPDSFHCFTEFRLGRNKYYYYSLDLASQAGLGDIGSLPISVKILLENLLRNEDEKSISADDIRKFVLSYQKGPNKKLDQVLFNPIRVLMQDFTGIPALVDLTAMRNAIANFGSDPNNINPLKPVDLVVDHSISADFTSSNSALKKNIISEFSKNRERYNFLKWGQQAFNALRIVPPGTGICHQINLEKFSKVIWLDRELGKKIVYPDTIIGTDSHTTMVNALSVLGWGVGGIEAEAVMLGQPISLKIPKVVGCKITGKVREGVTSTDVVLSLTNLLRSYGVVGKFIEFYGSGLNNLSLADRSTISNMSPEYGATCSFFPIDQEVLKYLKFTGRTKEQICLVEKYAKIQGLWRINKRSLKFNSTLNFDLSSVQPCLSGPKNPSEKSFLNEVPKKINKIIESQNQNQRKYQKKIDDSREVSSIPNNGDVLIAAITSCANTSNPNVLVSAALLAKKAVNKGLKTCPWVKTSFAPGSRVVREYLYESGLQKYLDKLGFHIVGYGCTTCIGNSGSLLFDAEKSIEKNKIFGCSVLSGNRNFEGRIHPNLRLNWLASPPLVVAYALAGNMRINLLKEPLALDKNGREVFLKDIWPANKEIERVISRSIKPEMYLSTYSKLFEGTNEWKKISVKKDNIFKWSKHSTYIKEPPFFKNMTLNLPKLKKIKNARPLLILADGITTDHISPAGMIDNKSSAGSYLKKQGVLKYEFNSFGSRRGNHEVMMRGTFSNRLLKNEILRNGEEGGFTRHMPSGRKLSIYDAAKRYRKEKVPLVIIAGKEYGSGSSRDWAAKGPKLLGIEAVIAESYERIHRSNLIGMGILPLEFFRKINRKMLGLIGDETIDISDFPKTFDPKLKMRLRIKRRNRKVDEIEVKCRIDTYHEYQYYVNGGILPYVLRTFLAQDQLSGHNI